MERSKDAGAEVVTKVLFRHTANAHDRYKVRKHSAAIAYVPAHSGGREGWIVAGGGLAQGARVSGGWAGGEAGGCWQDIRTGGPVEDSMDTKDLKLDDVFLFSFFFLPQVVRVHAHEYL